MAIERSYEVETRVYFNSYDEAFNTLPFLKGCLTKENKWITKTFSMDLFKTDKLLRVSEVEIANTNKFYLGYKEPDLGKTCNIRLELDENITNGIECSEIIRLLGGESKKVSPENLNEILESLGHKEFMVFNGFNLSGKHTELELSLKLMNCAVLEYPLMLEIEKTAISLEDAYSEEKNLLDIVNKFGLSDRIIRKEPPTLLYERLNNK